MTSLLVWWAIVISVLLIAGIIAFFAAGVRIQVSYNSDYENIVADIYLFGRIHAAKLRLMMIEEKLYYQAGNKRLKRLGVKRAENIKEKAKKNGKKAIGRGRKVGINDLAYIVKGVKLKELSIGCRLGAKESAATSLACCAVSGAISTAIGVLSPVIKEEGLSVICTPDYDKAAVRAHIDILIGVGMLQIIFRVLRIILRVKR